MNKYIFYSLLLLHGSIFISSLEYIVSKSTFAKKGLLEWNMLRLRENVFTHKFYDKYFDLIYGRNTILFFIGMFVLSSSSLLAILLHLNFTILITLSISLNVLLLLYNYRCKYALDGSDQFNTISLTALTLCFLFEPQNFALYFLPFVAFQLTLSYFISGIFKLTSLEWLSGKALTNVFALKVYGHHYVSKTLKQYPPLSILLSSTVILWEVSFPLSFLLGENIFLFYLVLGAMFHLFNAIFMGLNCFFLSFISGYPALIYCYYQMGV